MVAKKNTSKKVTPKKTAEPATKSPKKAAVKTAAPSVKKPLAGKPVAKKPASPLKKAAPVTSKPATAKKAAKKAAPLKKAPAPHAEPKVKHAASQAVFQPKASSAKAENGVQPATKPAAVNGSHSASFISKQRQRLLDLRDDLVDSMSGMTRDTIRNAPEGSEASGSGQHQGDAGSDAYDRDFALSVLAKEQDALYEIEQALRRIQSGTYGICEISSYKIPQARLEAIPFARLTVECQAQWEKEYGKRRFRPTNEVGFSGGNYMDDEDSDSVSLDEEED
jgi:DnaK suppressor protein